MSVSSEEFRNCDLDSPNEILEMVTRFYAKVAQDDQLGPVFNDVAKVDWPEHIPKIARFWNLMLLGTQGYVGNPLEAHEKIHSMSTFTHEQFKRWLELFQETVDAGWQGEYAQTIKRKAVKIALTHSRLLTGEPLHVLLDIDTKK